jgi:hypothetical protein
MTISQEQKEEKLTNILQRRTKERNNSQTYMGHFTLMVA